MTETLFHAPDEFRKNAWIMTMDEYRAMYTQSIEDPDTFWAGMADNFHWEKNGTGSGNTTIICPKARSLSSGSSMGKPISVTTAWTGTCPSEKTKPR